MEGGKVARKEADADDAGNLLWEMNTLLRELVTHLTAGQEVDHALLGLNVTVPASRSHLPAQQWDMLTILLMAQGSLTARVHQMIGRGSTLIQNRDTVVPENWMCFVLLAMEHAR